MDEILKNAMNGKELDMDELQKVTGGFQIDASQVGSLVEQHCKTCDYAYKWTECINYLNTVIAGLQAAGEGGKVEVDCPQGRVKL